MPRIDFGPQVAALQAEGINLAKSSEPKFADARARLDEAEYLTATDPSSDTLKAAIFNGRNHNDLGVVDVREGLYHRNYSGISNQETLGFINSGVKEIELSYISLACILEEHKTELRDRGWVAGVHGHIAATMNTWFRTTQTAQLVVGDIGSSRKADQAAVDAQWMLGRGRPDEPGAWVHGRQGDNGYWSTQTAFLGLRGERINGGPVHLAKGLKWAVARGFPELLLTLGKDPENRTQAVLTAGRLSLESISRKRSIKAALDYRYF